MLLSCSIYFLLIYKKYRRWVLVQIPFNDLFFIFFFFFYLFKNLFVYTVALSSTLGAAILTFHCYYDMYHQYILLGVGRVQEIIRF